MMRPFSNKRKGLITVPTLLLQIILSITVNTCTKKRDGDVFLKSHIFALVAGAFYKSSNAAIK